MLKLVGLLSRATGTYPGFQAYRLIRQGRVESLFDIRPPDPLTTRDADLFRREAQVFGFFKKLKGLVNTTDLHQKAVETYFACEDQNARTNDRLLPLIDELDRGGCFLPIRVQEAIREARTLVKRILGPLPGTLIPAFSGGSTFYDRGDKITIPHKLESNLATTPGCRLIAEHFLAETFWGKTRLSKWEISEVLGNRFTSVPKDSTKNRGICVEPLLNVCFQLPVGAHIRDRLKRTVGIEIAGEHHRNAQYVHRELARHSSLDRGLATLDLSNASDTVSYGLVKLLLPKDWFDLLCSLRSPYTQVDGKWYKNHKFSSMGNGFTFELETTLFYAISKVVAGYASVFGDDTIVPTAKAADVIAALKFFGLTVNEQKSFVATDNPFRESCGGDYFNGQAVRPYYLKEEPSGPIAWMELHNTIRRLIDGGVLSGPYALDALTLCVHAIPTNLRFWGPVSHDGVLHTEDRSKWTYKKASDSLGPLGYNLLRKLEAQPRKIGYGRFSSETHLCSALLGCPSTGLALRDSVASYKRVWRSLMEI